MGRCSCQPPQPWGRGGMGKSSRGTGVGTAAGAHRAHPVPTISHPAWGPHSPSHAYLPLLPPHACPLAPDSLSLYHTHTHISFPCGLAPLHIPPRTLTSAKPESRGMGLGWTKLTFLQMGPFPWVSFGASHTKLQSQCHWVEWGAEYNWAFGGKRGSGGSGQAGAAAPDSRRSGRSAGQHKGTGGQ